MKLFFLLASLAYVNASTTSSDVGVDRSLLRGSSTQERSSTQEQQQQLLQRRSLLDLNEMKCTSYSSGDGIADGSVICEFRVFPPSDPQVGTLHHSCAYIPTLSKSMCLSAEVYNVNFNDLPEDFIINDSGGSPSSPINNESDLDTDLDMDEEPSLGDPDPMPDIGMPDLGIPEPGIPDETMPDPDPDPDPDTGGNGGCPSDLPLPGSDCSESIPDGASEVSCMYDGSIQCNCAGQDNDAIDIGWSCRDLNNSGGGDDGDVNNVTPIITRPSIEEEEGCCAELGANNGIQSCSNNDRCNTNQDRCEMFECSGIWLPPTLIDADVSSGNIPAVVPVQVVQIPECPGGKEGCPLTKPFQDGIDCPTKNLRCCYYDSNENPTTLTNCDCTKDDGFVCRAPFPI